MQKLSFVTIMIACLGIHLGAAGESRPLVLFAGPNISSIAFKGKTRLELDLGLGDASSFEGSGKSSEIAAGFTGGIGFKPQSFPGSTLALSYTYHGKFTPVFETSFSGAILGIPVSTRERVSGSLHVHTLDLVGRWEIFDNDNAFQPYLAASLGAAQVKGKVNYAIDGSIGGLPLAYSTPYYNFQKTAFVGGVGAGFRYALTDKISMTADYFFKAGSTMNQRIEGIDCGLKMTVHQVSLGFNLTF